MDYFKCSREVMTKKKDSCNRCRQITDLIPETKAKKSSLASGNWPGEFILFITYPSALSKLYQNVYFLFQKKKKKKKEKHRHTYKEKGEETKKDWLVVNFEIYSDTFPLVNFKSIMADVQLVEFRYIY